MRGADKGPGASVLLVLDALPLPLTEGDRLRSYHLGRALAEDAHCVLAAPATNPEHLEVLRRDGPFDDVLLLPERPGGGRARRLLRSDNSTYLRNGWPEWFDDCRRQLQRFMAQHRVGTVVAGKLPMAELVACLEAPFRVLDDFDCYTLTLEREYALHRTRMSVKQRIAHRLSQHRYRRQESHLSGSFGLVTTISPADGDRLESLDPAARVEVIPNGVDSALLDVTSVAEGDGRGVAFWGNLAFEPNRSAVEWFIDQVYGPHLAVHAIPCYLIGGGADTWIETLPARYPEVRVTGFVNDLASLVREVPVMINPMVSGSGLKNKMLEAMALGRAVVSTAMGSEALAVQAQEDYLRADDPLAFARAILALHDRPQEAQALGERARQRVAAQYTWPRVEARWREVFASLGAAAT